MTEDRGQCLCCNELFRVVHVVLFLMFVVYTVCRLVPSHMPYGDYALSFARAVSPATRPLSRGTYGEHHDRTRLTALFGIFCASCRWAGLFKGAAGLRRGTVSLGRAKSAASL